MSAAHHLCLSKLCIWCTPPSACAALDRASRVRSPPCRASQAAGMLRTPISCRPCRTACIRYGSMFLRADTLIGRRSQNMHSGGAASVPKTECSPALRSPAAERPICCCSEGHLLRQIAALPFDIPELRLLVWTRQALLLEAPCLIETVTIHSPSATQHWEECRPWAQKYMQRRQHQGMLILTGRSLPAP